MSPSECVEKRHDKHEAAYMWIRRKNIAAQPKAIPIETCL